MNSDSSDDEFDFYNSENESSSDDDSDAESDCDDCEQEIKDFKWLEITDDFVSLKQMPTRKEPETIIKDSDSKTDIFFHLFPKSLFMWICECTNQRLDIFGSKKGRHMVHTDYHEIIKIVGCLLLMAYNRLPYFSMYFSRNISLGNHRIKLAFSRDRFLLIWSKLYFNNPEKPADASKTYYMDEMVNCLKYTFSRARSESSFQSIDETMIKCKGRTSLKQHMQSKPIKDGVKVWHRCDAETGYAYDFNIYKGAEERVVGTTLGERVVTTLCATIRSPDVAIFTDRFFTSVQLMKTSAFACVGTVMSNRKNLPSMTRKLLRGDSEGKCLEGGVVCFKWKDSKEFMLLSNCHDGTISTADRKAKDGSIKTYDCPAAIVDYNKYMGGVDKTDQYTVIYDIDRKSNKWWKRTFQRLLMTAVTNSWILYQRQQNKKIPLIDFLIPLSEDLIEIGKSGTQINRKSGSGRPSKKMKLMRNVGHMPMQTTKRRCSRCASKKLRKERQCCVRSVTFHYVLIAMHLIISNYMYKVL